MEHKSSFEKSPDYLIKSNSNDLAPVTTNAEGHTIDVPDALHRRLNNRQIQLIAIGGSIGTAIFVTVGSGLAKGGPGSLFLAYLIYSCFLGLVNNGIAELTVLYPVSGASFVLQGK